MLDKSDKENNKIYLIGELEKLVADKDYYMKNDKKKKEFIEGVSGLLYKIESYELDKKEKKLILKLVDFLKRARKFLK